jgi:hypothetical protein
MSCGGANPRTNLRKAPSRCLFLGRRVPEDPVEHRSFVFNR